MPFGQTIKYMLIQRCVLRVGTGQDINKQFTFLQEKDPETQE